MDRETGRGGQELVFFRGFEGRNGGKSWAESRQTAVLTNKTFVSIPGFGAFVRPACEKADDLLLCPGAKPVFGVENGEHEGLFLGRSQNVYNLPAPVFPGLYF